MEGPLGLVVNHNSHSEGVHMVIDDCCSGTGRNAPLPPHIFVRHLHSNMHCADLHTHIFHLDARLVLESRLVGPEHTLDGLVDGQMIVIDSWALAGDVAVRCTWGLVGRILALVEHIAIPAEHTSSLGASTAGAGACYIPRFEGEIDSECSWDFDVLVAGLEHVLAQLTAPNTLEQEPGRAVVSLAAVSSLDALPHGDQ